MRIPDQAKVEIRENLDTSTAKAIYEVLKYATFKEQDRYLSIEVDGNSSEFFKVRRARLEGYKKLSKEFEDLILKIKKGEDNA